jgi:hypothetical protein
MKQTNCPYVKISSGNFAMNTQTDFSNFTLVSTAHAQTADDFSNQISSMTDSLTVPFYLLLGSFFLFVVLMSVVFMYHWTKFSIEDPMIKSFIPIYFIGLIVLTVPIVFNLIF